MPSSQSFSRIQRRISDSPDPAAPVNSGEPLNLTNKENRWFNSKVSRTKSVLITRRRPETNSGRGDSQRRNCRRRAVRVVAAERVQFHTPLHQGLALAERQD